jgi:hypothetical protein
MDTLTSLYSKYKKHVPIIVAISFAAIAYKMNVEKNVIVAALIAMGIIYFTSKKEGESSGLNKMEADIKKIQTENEGLKQNLIQVYNMVKSANAPPRDMPRNVSAPDRQGPQKMPQSQPTPSDPKAEDGDDGRPYM